jgi:calpain-7
MTVGTNDKTALSYNIHSIKLLPSHDYAVTGAYPFLVRYGQRLTCADIKETNDERWVTLLDSRICGSECECSGSGSCPSRLTLLFLLVDVTDGSGVIDMRWDDICATFEGLYISWNPSLFGSAVTFHGCVFTSYALNGCHT